MTGTELVPAEDGRQPDRLGHDRALLVALAIAGLGLRAQIVGVGPLLPELTANLRVTHAVGGLLTALPLLLMGLVSIPAAPIVARLGGRAAITLCVVLVGVAGSLRALAPDAWSLLALTLPIGAGIGLAGVALPTLVKRRLPSRPATGTGVYVSGIVLGSAAAGMTAVPLAALLGDWRSPLFTGTRQPVRRRSRSIWRRAESRSSDTRPRSTPAGP